MEGGLVGKVIDDDPTTEKCMVRTMTESSARLPEFQVFNKIPRLHRWCIVTEKIDGTNAQVYVPEDPNEPILAGSRKRWITPESDNFGFAAWVRDHEDELRQLGPGRHFGEWWGRGIQRNYGLTERRFSLFNVNRWRDQHDDPDTWAISPNAFAYHCLWHFREYEDTRLLAPECCRVVPVLAFQYSLAALLAEDIQQTLRNNGSAAAPGFMQPEGLVIWHKPQGHLFKVTLENDDEPKGRKDE